MRNAIIVILTVVCGALYAAEPARSALLGQETRLKVDQLPGASADWLSAVQADIQGEEYSVSRVDKAPLPSLKGAWQAPNRAQGFRTYFTEKGIRLVPRAEEGPSWEWGLELVAWGRPGRAHGVPAASPTASANRAEYRRGSITEWYANDERGLEQGFTIPVPPANKAESKSPHSSLLTPHCLCIDLALSGTLHPRFSEDGQAVDFYHNGNFNVLRYAKLEVTDATGRRLPSRFEGFSSSLLSPHSSLLTASVGGIRIAIDDSGAVYPITVDPLATSPAWTAEGNQASAIFGACVATAGDVNGDGYSDVIVGADSYDTGLADAGRVFVYHGSATGLSATANWTAESDQVSPFFGQSVSTAGDVNGDGYSDVIVGSFLYDNGQVNEGRAFAWFGSSTGLGANGTPANADWTSEGDQANAFFGCSVATAGDVNGDGYSDVIVGAYQYSNGQASEGRAFVYHGSASGLSATANWTAESDQSGAFFGNSVATAGDVDGDGYSDILVGATYYNGGQSQEGRAYVYHGSASGLGASPAWTAEINQASARFGSTLAAAGDVNGDGYADVIIGAYFYDSGQTDEGKAFVYHGSASGLSATANWTAEGDQTYAYFGSSVRTAGDINGDGYSDIVVGAPSYDNGQADEGRAFVYFGSASGLGSAAAWTAESDQSSSSFGGSVATAGDVNGDGYSDVVVAARNYDNGETDEGRAYLYLGSAAGLSAGAGWTAESDQASARLGLSVATGGDVNGDGYADIIVGAMYYDNGQTDEGRAYVYHGSASGLDTTADWSAESDQASAYLGRCVATAGDVNGDGYADVIIGAEQYDNGQTNEGGVFVYHGSASGLGATAVWTAESDQASARLGRSVATAGDVNGDGYADIIIGAEQYDNGQADEGRALVYLGSASGLSTTAAWTAESDQASAFFGVSVATAGDVNGDGYSDVIVGASGYDNVETEEGRAFVYHGSAAGLSATANWAVESDQVSAYLGSCVATAGDVNGDGYSDVIVGAINYDNGQTDEGRAYVYYGSASGLSATANWTAESDQASARFGQSVATAGDVNGDGYSDIIVGASAYANGQTEEGRTFVYQGSASGLSTAAAWIAESDQTSAFFGYSVASAGDVNGDGYADVVVGATNYDNGETDEGRAFVYYGNGGPGMSLTPQQRRADDAAPIAHLGKSDAGRMFEATLLGRTPYGRGKFKVEWEVKPLGTLFDGTVTGTTTDWQDTGVTGLLRKEIVSGLTADSVYHWRARLIYHPATAPFQQASRWLTIPWNGWQEADLRTSFGDADLGVSQADSTDPMLRGGGNITYTVTIGNAGPDQADAVLTDTLPPGTTFVSATPSQGSCSEAGGVVTCGLGVIASSGSAIVQVVVTPPLAGSYTNHAAVSSPAGDNNPGNNSADEMTTVNAPAIGNFVWADADGDGIQDAGETGMDGVIVQLYDSSYSWLAQKVTDPSGFYQFTGLTYGNSYFVKVIPPSAGYSFSQPDQGSDDTLDSDVSITTGQPPILSLVNGLDPSRWDAGMVYQISCEPPDEPVWIYMVTLSVPDGYPILHFQDPNQPGQRTGYHVRRSDNPALPKPTWPLIATNVVDMDAGTPNIQWTDTSADIPPSGTWYYQVTAYNAYCPAEGPF